MGYRVKHYNKSTEYKVIVAILKGLWWLVSWPFKLLIRKNNKVYQPNAREFKSLDQEFLHQKWAEIEQLLALGKPSNYSRAVLEADKLLDHILKGLHTPGLTMGDRLKSSEKRFSREGYNAAWQGHKVRNELVHNSEYELTDFMARQAIENFARAIGELYKVK